MFSLLSPKKKNISVSSAKTGWTEWCSTMVGFSTKRKVSRQSSDSGAC